jgi:hypothetical protein
MFQQHVQEGDRRRSLALRRLILVAVVLAACSQIESRPTLSQTCNISTAERAAVAPRHGQVELAWAFEQGFAAADGRWGETTCQGRACVVRLAGPAPAFDDICGLARLGHEVRHVIGEAR